jgi:hypothetical protein
VFLEYGRVNASVPTPDSTSAIELRASLFVFLALFLRGFRYKRLFYGDKDSGAINGWSFDAIRAKQTWMYIDPYEMLVRMHPDAVQSEHRIACWKVLGEHAR